MPNSTITNYFCNKLVNYHIDKYLFPSNIIANASQLDRKFYKVIYLGCDESRFYYREKKSNDRATILAIGRLDPIKGYFKLLDLYYRSFGHMKNKPILKIIGKSSNLSVDEIKKYGCKIGLNIAEDIVFISDFIENIEEHIASADLGIVSSLGSEVICRVTEEFLLSGTATIVNDVGSLKECMFDDAMGEVMDLEQFESASKLLVSSVEKYRNESQADKIKRAKLSLEYFSFNSMRQSFNELVQAIF